MKRRSLTPPQKWILLGIPVLFLLGSFMHSLYDLSGNNAVVGAIAAVNESVWEHSKLILFPFIAWWAIYYLVKAKKYSIDPDKWFTAAMAALVTALITMPMLFYFYTEAFGIESLAIDIIIFLIVVILGQLMGFHVYKYSKGTNPWTSIGLIVLIALVFVLLTFCPLHIPLLQDSTTGLYGIQ